MGKNQAGTVRCWGCFRIWCLLLFRSLCEDELLEYLQFTALVLCSLCPLQFTPRGALAQPPAVRTRRMQMAGL